MLFCLAWLTTAGFGAAKPHVIGFGKWTTIKWCAGPNEGKCLDLRVRTLCVDGRAKESTRSPSHEITERLFAVRRAFQVNDSLPGDIAAAPGWVWQRGGWLLADRMTGHISAIALPEFDPYSSVASRYRDYAAYCGVSDDGKKLFAIVFQVGRRKPVLKKPLGDAEGGTRPIAPGFGGRRRGGGKGFAVEKAGGYDLSRAMGRRKVTALAGGSKSRSLHSARCAPLRSG